MAKVCESAWLEFFTITSSGKGTSDIAAGAEQQWTHTALKIKKTAESKQYLLVRQWRWNVKGPVGKPTAPHLTRCVCVCAKSLTDVWKKKNLPFVMQQRVVIPHRRLSKVRANTPSRASTPPPLPALFVAPFKACGRSKDECEVKKLE